MSDYSVSPEGGFWRGRIAVSPIDYREAQVLMNRIARPASTEDFNDAWSALVDAFLHYERLVKALERELGAEYRPR